MEPLDVLCFAWGAVWAVAQAPCGYRQTWRWGSEVPRALRRRWAFSLRGRSDAKSPQSRGAGSAPQHRPAFGAAPRGLPAAPVGIAWFPSGREWVEPSWAALSKSDKPPESGYPRLKAQSREDEQRKMHQSIQNLGFVSIISQQPLSVIICLACWLRLAVFERPAGVERAVWKFPSTLFPPFGRCFHKCSFTLPKFSLHFWFFGGLMLL